MQRPIEIYRVSLKQKHRQNARANRMSICVGNDTSDPIEYQHVSSWKLRNFNLSNDAICLGERV